MLYEYRTYEETDEDGCTWIKVTGELIEHPCDRCGGESVANLCPGDGRNHHHGCVHTADGDFQALCAECIVDAAHEWADRTQFTSSVRQTIESL